MSERSLLRRAWRLHYAVPAEHGSWIWWIGPFLVGIAAAGGLTPALLPLAVAALAAFLMRQPASLLVKTLSGRRRAEDREPAALWLGIYLLITLSSLAVLLLEGHARLLLLAVPGLPVFGWHLWLVSRREERGKPGVEVIAAGVLALSAPAAYWTAGGESVRLAWLLWAITWLQAAASIVFVHLRLRQRRLVEMPSSTERWRMGSRALAYAVFNVLASLIARALGWMPTLVPVAFGLMLLDTIEGVLRPALGVRPTAIGLRQLAMSILYILTLVAAFLS